MIAVSKIAVVDREFLGQGRIMGPWTLVHLEQSYVQAQTGKLPLLAALVQITG